jgi:hypothetical protein
MKYPLIELRKAYFDALKTVLPVYDGQVPADIPDRNYIILGEAVMIPQRDKSNFFNEVVLTIDVVNKTYNTGYKEVSEFVNDVTAIINQDTLLTMPSFVMDNQVIEDIQNFNNLTDKEKVFRAIIRVRCYITEK